jgi:hypothetical protein
MAIVQSVRYAPILVEKVVSLAATSGTTVGISVPAGTTVLAAGFQNFTVVPDVTTYTVAVTDGTTTFMAATSFDNTAANTNKGGVVPGFIAAADTVDVLTSITGSPGIITGRVWAVVVDCSKSVEAAADVDRDQLA